MKLYGAWMRAGSIVGGKKEEDFTQRTQRRNTEVTEKRKGSWLPKSLEKF
jgi:hypothetical protein